MAKSTDPLAVTNHGNLSVNRPVRVLTDDYTVRAEESGYVFMIGTDDKVVTLPAVGSLPPGFNITVINIGADGNNNVRLTPAATDSIRGRIATNAATSAASGVAGKYWDNTKATAIRGDHCSIVADGTTSWYITEGMGVWASEA